VLFYAGAGGYGDQLMAWPAAKILSDLGYKVHVLCDPGNELCWANFEWVKSIQLLPIEQDQLEMYENLALYEYVTNNDEHDDKVHPVDNLLFRMGINPDSISADKKCVKPIITPREFERASEMVKNRKIALYQLATTSAMRSMLPDASADLFASLARAFPEFHWVGLYDQFNKEAYVAPAKSATEGLSNADLFYFENFRMLFAVASMATAAVSADSFLVHLAGAYGVPTVGIWGPTRADLRVKYYPNHVPVFAKFACPMAPCLRTTREFPPYCPPSAEPRKVCAVVGATTPDDVIEALKRALRH
jgi:ADP-heptose:LPS heptosyltransferase